MANKAPSRSFVNPLEKSHLNSSELRILACPLPFTFMVDETLYLPGFQ
ncbi:hypothetical protein [Cylindrospermum stagnale]|nr:hypothetical protein [Cylindrospermum stagnale]